MTDSRIRDVYGAGVLHLLTLLACLGFGGYAVFTLGASRLWDPNHWWQSIAVWFLGALIGHDLVMFPLYTLADRAYLSVLAVLRPRLRTTSVVPAVNYIRAPTLATGITFIVFFPGIIQQGASTYLAATGQTQNPFLQRWLLLTGVFFAVSALLYAIRLRRQRTP